MNGFIGAFDAKTNFSKLLERAERGETIIVTRHGKPVAKIGPVDEEAKRLRRREAAEAMERWLSRPNPPTLGGLDWKALRDEGRK
jgi:prevent-host-death family protein